MAEYRDLTEILTLAKDLEKRTPSSFYNGIQSLLQEIINLPAADVQPVKHGYIKTAKKDDNRRCSECRSNLTLTMYSIPDNPAGELLVTTPRFCPHCGAKLDGGTE